MATLTRQNKTLFIKKSDNTELVIEHETCFNIGKDIYKVTALTGPPGKVVSATIRKSKTKEVWEPEQTIKGKEMLDFFNEAEVAVKCPVGTTYFAAGVRGPAGGAATSPAMTVTQATQREAEREREREEEERKRSLYLQRQQEQEAREAEEAIREKRQKNANALIENRISLGATRLARGLIKRRGINAPVNSVKEKTLIKQIRNSYDPSSRNKGTQEEQMLKKVEEIEDQLVKSGSSATAAPLNQSSLLGGSSAPLNQSSLLGGRGGNSPTNLSKIGIPLGGAAGSNRSPLGSTAKSSSGGGNLPPPIPNNSPKGNVPSPRGSVPSQTYTPPTFTPRSEAEWDRQYSAMLFDQIVNMDKRAKSMGPMTFPPPPKRAPPVNVTNYEKKFLLPPFASVNREKMKTSSKGGKRKTRRGKKNRTRRNKRAKTRRT
jgi:hypothetical protein